MHDLYTKIVEKKQAKSSEMKKRTVVERKMSPRSSGSENSAKKKQIEAKKYLSKL